MGRLRRSKIEELRKLYDQKFTQIEAAEKTGLSRATCGSYYRRWNKEEREKQSSQPSTGSPGTVHALVKSFFNLLSAWKVSAFLDEDSVQELIDDVAYDFFSQIVGSNPDKAMVLNNPYLELLKDDILDLQTPDSELTPEVLKRRKKWIGLLKRYPEILKEIV